METSRKRVVITGGTAAVLLFAITVISKSSASVTVASRDEVESNPPISSVITTTSSSTPEVTTTSCRVTVSPKAKTTIKTTEKNISESSSKPEAVTTTSVTTTEPETVKPQSSYVETTAGYMWNEYSVNYVETNVIKETTTTTSTTMVKDSEETTSMVEEKTVEEESKKWDGPVLNSYAGIVSGPSGNETYYNLNMSGVVASMESLGYDYDYWVRDDGVKMYGDYVMCAADLSTRPKGTIVDTSLGEGIVCDTGGFVGWDPNRLDIATNW